MTGRPRQRCRRPGQRARLYADPCRAPEPRSASSPRRRCLSPPPATPRTSTSSSSGTGTRRPPRTSCGTSGLGRLRPRGSSTASWPCRSPTRAHPERAVSPPRAMRNRGQGGRAWAFSCNNWAAVNERFPTNSIVRMLECIRALHQPEVPMRSSPSSPPRGPPGRQDPRPAPRTARVNVALRRRESARLARAPCTG